MNVLILTNSGAKAQNNFKKTVLKKLNLNKLLKDDKENLQKIINSKLDLNKEYSIWGYNSKKDQIQVSENNQFVLAFYKNKKFYSLYKIYCCFESEKISLKLWETNERSNIVIIEKIADINISLQEFNLKMDYKPGNIVLGMILYDFKRNSEKVENFLDLVRTSWIQQTESKFQLLDNFFEQRLEYQTTIKIRGEQSKIRDFLKQKGLLNHCSICGQKNPEFCLDAAHIYKRTFLTELEKRDISNVALAMCLFGCNVLWENGYIIVDEKGFIRKNHNLNKLDQYEYFQNYLNKIIDKKILYYNEKNRIYFEKHRKFHTTK